ncbi:hypothetical protein D3C76_1557470 [compost metagenome]
MGHHAFAPVEAETILHLARLAGDIPEVETGLRLQGGQADPPLATGQRRQNLFLERRAGDTLQQGRADQSRG